MLRPAAGFMALEDDGYAEIQDGRAGRALRRRDPNGKNMKCPASLRLAGHIQQPFLTIFI
jgi:hypothetical protein